MFPISESQSKSQTGLAGRTETAPFFLGTLAFQAFQRLFVGLFRDDDTNLGRRVVDSFRCSDTTPQ